MAVSTRAEIDRTRIRDRLHPQNLSLLGARVRAVAEAQRAITGREEGAAPALRQSLVDLAAVAECLAGRSGRSRPFSGALSACLAPCEGPARAFPFSRPCLKANDPPKRAACQRSCDHAARPPGRSRAQRQQRL